VVVSLHTLEHLKKPEKMISEIYRVLKKDGILIFTVPNTKSLLKYIKGDNWFGYRDKSHVSLLSPEEWFGLIEKHDFKTIKAFSDGFWDAPYIPLIPAVIQKPFFGFLTAIEFVSGYPFIPVRLGENIVVILKKI
jgi:SAM-dependent methyltransferase